MPGQCGKLFGDSLGLCRTCMHLLMKAYVYDNVILYIYIYNLSEALALACERSRRCLVSSSAMSASSRQVLSRLFSLKRMASPHRTPWSELDENWVTEKKGNETMMNYDGPMMNYGNENSVSLVGTMMNSTKEIRDSRPRLFLKTRFNVAAQLQGLHLQLDSFLVCRSMC